MDKSSEKKKGTGKFIVNPGGDRYTTKPARDGDWVTINKDLLPLIREGLETAWHRGYLQHSCNPADYHLGSMNMGWEVTGPLNVAVQVRDFRLCAEPCPA